jgi:hypothetical protein
MPKSLTRCVIKVVIPSKNPETADILHAPKRAGHFRYTTSDVKNKLKLRWREAWGDIIDEPYVYEPMEEGNRSPQQIKEINPDEL